jgi:adenosine deaminase
VDEAATAAEAVVRGARREAERWGVSVALVVTLGRHFGVARNEPAARLLHRPVGAMLVGLDLAGDESFPAQAFEQFLREWRTAGKGLTIHAGEDSRGAGAENVRQAVVEWSADRIGHGVQAHGDKELVRLLARRGTVIEACPTSNVQTRACRSFREHPLQKLLSAGVTVTINTDDPAVSGTTLSNEYLRAFQRCGLTCSELRTCALNAARGAFLPREAAARLRRRVEAGWGG